MPLYEYVSKKQMLLFGRLVERDIWDFSSFSITVCFKDVSYNINIYKNTILSKYKYLERNTLIKKLKWKNFNFMIFMFTMQLAFIYHLIKYNDAVFHYLIRGNSFSVWTWMKWHENTWVNWVFQKNLKIKFEFIVSYGWENLAFHLKK